MNQTTQEMCLFFQVIRIADPPRSIKATAVATSAIHLITATMAIFGNTLMLYIFWNFKRLQTASNLLLASLCITDLLTGIVVQPLSMARRTLEAWGEHNCNVRTICAYYAFLCIGASIQNVAIISIDRWIAIKMPFRYPNIATIERYAKVIVSTWVLWALFIMMPFFKVLRASQFFIAITSTVSFNILIVLVSYGQIFRVVLKHRKQINQQHRQHSIHRQQSADTRRTNTNTIAIVIVVMLFCYLPLLPLLIIRSAMGDSVNVIFILDTWADVFIYANSSANPIIYWYRSKEIKRAIHIVLRRWRLLPRTRTLQCSRRTAHASIFSLSLALHKISPPNVM